MFQPAALPDSPVRPLSAQNYHGPIPNVDNNMLDLVIMREFANILDITGPAGTGGMAERHFKFRDGVEFCDKLIQAANWLKASIDQFPMDQADVLAARKTFEKYLVATYNFLSEVDFNDKSKTDFNKLNKQGLTQKVQLKLCLGFILDVFYKETAVAGQYRSVVNKFDQSHSLFPKLIRNIQYILQNPQPFIAEYHYSKRFKEFNNLLRPFGRALAGEQPSLDKAKFIQLLEQFSDVSELALCEGFINDHGLKLVLEALTPNKTIKTLDLDENGLTVKGMELLADWLKHDSNVETLSLDDDIGDMGLDTLLKGLSNNKTLKDLSLQGCKFTIAGIRKLTDFLKTNISLSSLTLTVNNHDEELLKTILKVFDSNKTLCYLNLRYYPEPSQDSALIQRCNELRKKISAAVEINRHQYELAQENSRCELSFPHP